jgi:hypothetical protein
LGSDIDVGKLEQAEEGLRDDLKRAEDGLAAELKREEAEARRCPNCGCCETRPDFRVMPYVGPLVLAASLWILIRETDPGGDGAMAGWLFAAFVFLPLLLLPRLARYFNMDRYCPGCGVRFKAAVDRHFE